MLNDLTTSNIQAKADADAGGRRPLFPLARRTRPRRRTGAADSAAERRIIARAQQGDEQAFAVLYEAYKRRVYAICLRMIHSEVDAEDLTQEAFLHLFRKISSFRGDAAFGTWLHRLVVNVVLMKLRRKALRMVSLEETSPQPGEDELGHRDFSVRQFGLDDPQLASAPDRITLDRAIGELPEGYRAILLLHDLEGYEHTEIATLRNCSVGNSKSQLHKARVKLRHLLRKGPAARRAALRAVLTIVGQVRGRGPDRLCGAGSTW
ncbi:MAG TPA: RNA polymerase sigma factor [Terriglobia bacterium]|nr:RNA polymerase sigma factor [Terriglobia bacterium]